MLILWRIENEGSPLTKHRAAQWFRLWLWPTVQFLCQFEHRAIKPSSCRAVQIVRHNRDSLWCRRNTSDSKPAQCLQIQIPPHGPALHELCKESANVHKTCRRYTACFSLTDQVWIYKTADTMRYFMTESYLKLLSLACSTNCWNKYAHTKNKSSATAGMVNLSKSRPE